MHSLTSELESLTDGSGIHAYIIGCAGNTKVSSKVLDVEAYISSPKKSLARIEHQKNIKTYSNTHI